MHFRGALNSGQVATCGLYSKLIAPSTVSLPRSFSVSISVGSPSLRMSHHSTVPSVLADIASVPVLDWSQAKL